MSKNFLLQQRITKHASFIRAGLNYFTQNPLQKSKISWTRRLGKPVINVREGDLIDV